MQLLIKALHCWKPSKLLTMYCVRVCKVSELITEHGLINLDFADVKAIMSNAGSALMGIGRASGENEQLRQPNRQLSRR